jgi:hypothetical protein
MPFTILNEADAFNANQAELDKVDFDILTAGIDSDGVLTGCAVTAQGSPDMTVAVAAGTIKVANKVVAVTAGNVTIGTADGTNPRFDLITVNDSGTKACTAGTAAAQPVFPAIPASSIVLAAVYVPASDTTIATNQITDKRAVISEIVPLIAQASVPTAPPEDSLILFAQALGGRIVPRWIGPSGLDTSVQPSLWGNGIVMWLPGTGTTAAINFGVSWTVSATQAHPTIANTNIMTSMRRATYTTTTTAGNQSGVRTAAPVAIRNRGFFFVARFGILTYTSTMQIQVGLNAASGAIAGDPSAINDSVLMSKDTGETTWQVLTRDTTAASKTTTGRTTAAAANAEIFDFYAFCKPGDSKITVRVVDIATNTVVLADTEKASNLPTNATVLYAHAECRNVAGGAGSAVAIFLSKMYIETDI